MKYYVSFAVDGRYVAEVESDNLYEAKKKAIESFSNADFGELQIIDGEMIIVEDESGAYVWEK